MSAKNINAILQRMEAEQAAKPVPRPLSTECTGCGVEFADSEDEEEDSEAYADMACDDCGNDSQFPPHVTVSSA